MTATAASRRYTSSVCTGSPDGSSWTLNLQHVPSWTLNLHIVSETLVGSSFWHRRGPCQTLLRPGRPLSAYTVCSIRGSACPAVCKQSANSPDGIQRRRSDPTSFGIPSTSVILPPSCRSCPAIAADRYLLFSHDLKSFCQKHCKTNSDFADRLLNADRDICDCSFFTPTAVQLTCQLMDGKAVLASQMAWAPLPSLAHLAQIRRGTNQFLLCPGQPPAAAILAFAFLLSALCRKQSGIRIQHSPLATAVLACL